MAQVKDVVCGMMVDSDSAAARSTFGGRTFYFCAVECRDTFEANPSKYSAQADGSSDDLEKHDKPYTKTGEIVSPKFGSAGSGGLEHEPGPERHGRDPR